jgi:two-component system, LytTR family, response regulator
VDINPLFDQQPPGQPMAEALARPSLFGRGYWGDRMKYRCVLVENEEISLARLKRLLAAFPEAVEVVGEAMDGPTAIQVIRDRRPDLVFMDIDLGGGFTGFDVLAALDFQPAVIFATAFNQHALQAFKTYAVDYLLKPIDQESIERALEKLRAMGFNQAQFAVALGQLLELSGSRYLTRLSCKVGDRIVLVKTGEVLYLQADNKYTALHTLNSEYLLDTPLVELEARLNPRDFVRIHRGTIINIAWISEIRRTVDGKLSVILKDAAGTQLLASRNYADNLKAL